MSGIAATAPRRMLLSGALAFGLGWFCAGGTAGAASFTCARAQTRVEKMICADPDLSRLDDALAAAYKQSTDVFATEGAGSVALADDLHRSQTAWLAQRNGCADATCVRAEYETRTRVLKFEGRTGSAAWVDLVAGIYKHAGFMTLWVQVRDDDSVRLSISGAEPDSAKWVCNFAGIAKKAADGSLVVAPPGGKAELTANVAKGAIEVPDNDVNEATSSNDCGMNGSLSWTYTRQ